MYSPKYVDYLDKMRIESTFYSPKSMLMCGKVTHKNLTGSSPYYSENSEN